MVILRYSTTFGIIALHGELTGSLVLTDDISRGYRLFFLQCSWNMRIGKYSIDMHKLNLAGACISSDVLQCMSFSDVMNWKRAIAYDMPVYSISAKSEFALVPFSYSKIMLYM